jgi:hypothetical protein
MLPATAHKSGVSAEGLCDSRKAAQAAAYYMSELLNYWGRDVDDVTLAIFSFNRDPERVKLDLSKLLGSPDSEQSFWTLVEGEKKLDREVRDELYYFPMFLAAAIVGENPQAFNLQMEPLSTHTK